MNLNHNQMQRSMLIKTLKFIQFLLVWQDKHILNILSYFVQFSIVSGVNVLLVFQVVEVGLQLVLLLGRNLAQKFFNALVLGSQIGSRAKLQKPLIKNDGLLNPTVLNTEIGHSLHVF